MSRVYIQGRVSTHTNIRRRYRIPRGSSPKVLVGQNVKPKDTLAVKEVACKHLTLDVASVLNIKPSRVQSSLVKSEGAAIEEGEVLAARRRLFRRRRVVAPFNGHIIRLHEGRLLLEGEHERVEIASTIPGRVVDIVPESYIAVETSGALVQIAWGHGGLIFGTLRVLDEIPGIESQPSRFNIDHRGSIIAIGAPLSEALIHAASDIRVRGLIAPSMDARLVSIAREMDFPIGLTQGFGHLPISERILSLLNNFNGREIVLDAGEDADWRERRPEIIIPLAAQSPQDKVTESPGNLTLKAGQKVRILQAPYLGEIGTVKAISKDSRQTDSGHWLAGADIEITPEETFFVPFANLEHLG